MRILVAIVALVFVICSVAASNEDIEDKAVDYFTECMEANEDTKQEIQDLRMEKITIDDVSENFKCALKCGMEKYEVINPETGEFLPEEFKARFSDEMAGDGMDKVIEACKDTKGESPCDTAFKTMICIHDYKA